MSLVTRCPSCGTPFKVVRDQLRISDGWVRCGRCSEVFDANADLQEAPGTDGPSEQPPATPNASADAAASMATTPTPTPTPTAHATVADVPVANDPPRDAAIDSHVDASTIDPLPPAIADSLDEPDFLDDEHETRPPDLSSDDGALPSSITSFTPSALISPITPTLTSATSAVDSFESIFADKPWPQKPLAATGVEELPMIPNYRTYPPFPSLDLGMSSANANADVVALQVPFVRDDEANTSPFQKALRRSREKSARIAEARSSRVVDERDAVFDAAAGAAQMAPHGAVETRALPQPLPSSREAVGDLAPTSVVKSSTPVVFAARSEPEMRASDGSFALQPSHPGNFKQLGAEPQKSPSALGTKAASVWQRLSRWSKGKTLLAVAIAAALLLVVQVLRQERDVIVAYHPGMQPLIAGLCAISGCQVAALRQIADIRIDGASFARERTGDAYRLNFTLRNSAEVPLAMPSIELSLLDTQERAVIRRVLMPDEFGAPAVLPARGERSASLPLALTGAEAAAVPPIAGFRVEALYP